MPVRLTVSRQMRTGVIQLFNMSFLFHFLLLLGVND